MEVERIQWRDNPSKLQHSLVGPQVHHCRPLTIELPEHHDVLGRFHRRAIVKPLLLSCYCMHLCSQEYLYMADIMFIEEFVLLAKKISPRPLNDRDEILLKYVNIAQNVYCHLYFHEKTCFVQ